MGLPAVVSQRLRTKESSFAPGTVATADSLRSCVAASEGWSGRWGSNPRRSACEADILPLNYSRFSKGMGGIYAEEPGLSSEEFGVRRKPQPTPLPARNEDRCRSFSLDSGLGRSTLTHTCISRDTGEEPDSFPMRGQAPQHPPESPFLYATASFQWIVS